MNPPHLPRNTSNVPTLEDDQCYESCNENDNCNTAHNSLKPYLLLDEYIYEDKTTIVSGGPTGPTAQTVASGAVHSAIVSERSESQSQFAASSNDRSHMQDVPVEQPAYFDQWIRVKSVEWNSESTTSNISITLPSDLVNVSSDSEFVSSNPALNLFNSSAFVSWDSIEAYVNVSAPPNVSGMALMTAFPSNLYAAGLRTGNGSDYFKSVLEIDKVRAFNMPSVKVSYTESNSAVLSVPWNFSVASASTTSNQVVPYEVVKIALYNFVPPECGTGSSSSVNLTMFVRFKGLRGEGKRPLNVPMTLDPKYSYQSNEEFGFKHSSKYADLCNDDKFSVSYKYKCSGPPHSRVWSADAVVERGEVKKSYSSGSCFSKQVAKQKIIKKIVDEKGTYQNLEKVLETVSNVASTVADLTNPVGLTSAIGSAVSGGLSGLLSSITLDAPWMNPAVESRVLPINVDNFPGAVGPRKVVVMDIDDSHHESPLEGVAYDDPNLNGSLFRPGLLFSVKVPVNTAPGVLFHIPCSVIDGCVSFDGVSNIDRGSFNPTPAGFNASLYQYVQGAKLYDFMLVKSVMQTVTLNFAFNPTFPPKGLGHALAGRSETVTFQEDVAKTIECPIISPWRMFPFNVPRLMLKTETGEPLVSFGYLTVSLVNNITSNALCADNITIVVSSRFSDNVKLFCPRVSPLTCSFSGPVATNSVESVALAGADSVDELEFQDDDHCWCDVCAVLSIDSDYETEFEDPIEDDDEEEDDEYVEDPVIDMKYGRGRFEDDEKEVEDYVNGASIATPVVNTSSEVMMLDGFGVSPSVKDCARRFDDLFTFKGELASSTDGTVRLFVIPISPIPGKTINPDSNTFQISSPNAFQVLSFTHAYFGGSLDVNLSITGIPNGTATVRYVNGSPMFTYVNNAVPLRTAVYNTNWHIIDVKTPLSIPAYVDQVIRDYTGLRAKEKRSLETNNQLTLGLPNHNEFSAISTVPVEMSVSDLTIPSVDQNNERWLGGVRPTIMGTLIVSIEVPNGQSVEGSLVVDMRAADTAHWSWPLGPPLCGTAVGNDQPPLYSLNLLETPNIVRNGNTNIYADANAALQHFSRPVGGSVGVSLYPVANNVSAAVIRKKLSESGDIETNPGPSVMSIMSYQDSDSEVSNNSSLNCFRKAMNSIKDGTTNTFKAVSSIPSCINGLTETIPSARDALGNLSNASLSVSKLSDTASDILEYVRLKIAGFLDLPIQSMLQILHYVQIMVCSRKNKSVMFSCFAGILFHLGLISFSSISTLASKLVALMKGSFQDSSSENIGVRYFNIVFSFILAGLGLAFTPIKKLPVALLSQTTAIFRNINTVDTFMRNNFDLISHGTTWITSTKQKCELMLLNIGEMRAEIESWLTTANVVCAPEFRADVNVSDAKQKMLIQCAKEGTLLFDRLVRIKMEAEHKDVNVVFNLVDKMLTKVRKVYLEHAGFFLTTDKYSVPFCVWLYGEPGIGKSHIVPLLASDYLTEMNIPADNDPLFRRTAGAKFWDGLESQPLLWFSDPEQDNSDAGISQFVKDWYEILSPIPFNPNMAHIDQKGKSHKFLGTFVDSNSFCSEKRKLVLSAEAFKSRRDVVAEIEIDRRFIEHVTGLGLQGRAKIEEYCSHVKNNPNDAYPGFENYSHLRVKYSFDGTKKPEREVSFAEFRNILKMKLKSLTEIRRLNSSAKSNLFENLSAENTAKRLAALSREEVAAAMATIEAITGVDTAEKLKVRIEEHKKDVKKTGVYETEGEFGDLYDLFDGSLEDRESVVDVFNDCHTVVDRDCKCIHDLLIKYCVEDMNYSIMNNRPCIMFPMETLQVLIGDDVGVLEPEVNGSFAYLPQTVCECTVGVRKMAFDLVKTYIEEEDCPVYEAALGLKLVKLHVERPSVLFKIVKFLSLLAVASAVVGLVVFLYRKFFSSGKTQDYERQMKTVKPRKAKVMQDNNPKFQDLEETIMKGCGNFRCEYRNEEGVLKEITTGMYCLGGTVWYLPAHTIKKLRNYKPNVCTFSYRTHAGSPIVFDVPWSECTTKYLFSVEHDVGVITHPRLQPLRSKVNLFANAVEISNISSDLCVYSWNNGTYCKTLVKDVKIQIVSVEDNKHQFLLYQGFQGNGRCGSPVVDRVSGKIVGFHDAGWANGRGGATICGKQLISKLVEASNALFVDVHDIETVNCENELKNEYCVVEKIVDPTFVGRISTKSSLYPSSMFGVLGEPEKVIPQGKLEDAFKCMEPYSKEPKYFVFPDKLVDGAADEYADVLIKFAPPVSAYKPRPLPLKTALEGIPNLPFHLPPMRDTSSGIPLVNMGLPKKGQCFTETIDQNGINITSLDPKFVSLYNEFTSELMSGCKPRSNAMLFLKDERKKPAKAIRGINGSDFVVHVLFLQYFLPFFAAYRKARFHVGSAIGCDIDSEAFDMFQHMGEVEEQIPSVKARYITADYKNFGPTIIHHFAGKIIDIIIKWYEVYGDVTPCDVMMMRRLFSVMLNSDHIVLHYWFRPQQGIFSGNPFTAEFNTFVNNLYIRAAWLYVCEHNAQLAKLVKGNPFLLFRKYVRVIMYGDDLVGRTHSLLYPLFNNVTIKEFMDAAGLEFTDALKRPTMVETDEFDKVSFLKRTFSLHPERANTMLAALDIGTIRDMICYVRGRGEIDSKSVVIAKDAVRFLHGHGRTTFDEMRGKIVSFCNNSDSSILRNAEFMSWDQVDAQIFDAQDELVRSLLSDV